MNVIETPLEGVLVIELQEFSDDRGSLMETFSHDRYFRAGVKNPTLQDNFVRSRHRVLRGLHYQEPAAQGKLVQALNGQIFDVCVDIRRGSPTFGKWFGVELSDKEPRQLWVPPGFAHGFCVLSETADVYYKLTTERAADHEHAIRWNDPAVGIRWPISEPILSARDAEAPLLAQAQVLPNYS